MDVNEILKTAKQIKSTYFMGTKAYHILGDISRGNEDLFCASEETEEYWVGSWIEGYGFVSVLFPKETSRRLTPEEIEHYKSVNYQLGGLVNKLNGVN